MKLEGDGPRGGLESVLFAWSVSSHPLESLFLRFFKFAIFKRLFGVMLDAEVSLAGKNPHRGAM